MTEELGPERAVGKYQVLQLLGEGGTADVFLAVAHGPSGFNKLVVLKALKRFLANQPDLRHMFLDEARLSARLSHPNIVEVNEVTEQDGLPVIVMNYIEGKPLADVIYQAGGTFTLQMSLRVIGEALSGLHYAHELTEFDGTPLNLVHRDMTPHNIFIAYDGRVKLLDFGIAKLGTAEGHTESGIIKGKINYMPPEQISGAGVDRRSDIFSVGVMLWEAATGQRLWQGVPETVVMQRVLNADVRSPRSVNPECNEHLDRICRKALAHEPQERYATAAELQADIEALLAELGTPPSVKEVGNFVAELYKEDRALTRSKIDAKLRENRSQPNLDKSLDLAFGTSIARQASASSSTLVERPGKLWRNVLLFAGVIASFALIFFLAMTRFADQQKAQDLQAAAPQQHQVRLRITVFPNQSALYLDGQRLGQNPYSIERTPDAAWHLVRAEAPGHRSLERRFKLDTDVELVLTLEAVALPSASASASVSESVRRRPMGIAVQKPKQPEESAPPPAAKPNCSPPYFLDEDGVKHFKPGCV